MAVREHIIVAIQFEKRLKLDDVDSMSEVLEREEIELSNDNTFRILLFIRKMLKKALSSRFSFLEMVK